MNEDNNNLLENVMGMLGENPAEKINQMLSALSSKNEHNEDEPKEEKDDNPFGQMDLDMILKMQSLMSHLSQDKPDERSALLSAIRPFLSEERRPQIDQMIKLLKLSQLAQVAGEMDIFKNLL